MEDGRVEALFEGENTDADKMLIWCQTGPPHARVSHVEVIEEPYTGNLRGFRIIYS